MSAPRPLGGLLVLSAVGALMFAPRAQAQLGVFGGGGGDGGGSFLDNISPESGPMVKNPWKADAGPEKDSGGGIMGAFAPFQSGEAGFLRPRAPHIADWVDEDAGPKKDGGGISFDFEVPTFGAAIDAGPRDAGPVVTAQVRIARPYADAVVLTSFAVPFQLVWAHVPVDVHDAMKAALPPGVKKLSYDALSRAQRAALWKALEAHKGWRQSHPAFLLGDVGRPMAAKLVAIGARVGHNGTVSLYGGFVAPRDGMHPPVTRAILVGSANVGAYKVAQLPRSSELPHDVKTLATHSWPQGKVPGVSSTVVPRTSSGMRIESVIRERKGAGCLVVTLDEKRAPVAAPSWRDRCGEVALATVDVEGDGLDEVIWQDGEHLTLRRYPAGDVLAENPPTPKVTQR